MTWEQIGPLVGVVVGAILGGSAQVLNDWIGSRRAERQRRQEAGRTFIEAFFRAVEAKQAASLTREGHFGDDDPQIAYQAALRSVGASITALHVQCSCLALIDDSEKTATLSGALVHMVEHEHGGTMGDATPGDDYQSLVAELVSHCGRR